MSQIHLLAPPYGALTFPGISPPPLGSIYVVALANRVDQLVEGLLAHRKALWCPVCFVRTPTETAVPDLELFSSYPTAFATIRAGRDGELPPVEPLVAAVRLRPVPGASVLAAWVAARLGQPAMRQLIEECCEIDPADRAAGYESARTLRRHASASGALGPARWRMLLELIHCLANPERQPASAVERLAFDCGSDPRTLRNRIGWLTGLTSRAALPLIGWEWIVEATLRMHIAKAMTG